MSDDDDVDDDIADGNGIERHIFALHASYVWPGWYGVLRALFAVFRQLLPWR